MNIKKTHLALLGITMLILASNYQIALAQASSTFYISTGLYPHSTSYTIWKSGSTYYAKNAYGKNIFSSSNASYVINSAIQTIPSYDDNIWMDSSGVIYLGAQNYELTASIILKDGTYLMGEGRYNTLLISTISDGSPVITTEGIDDSKPQYNILVSDLCIIGNGNEGDGIYYEYCVRDCLIQRVEIQNVGGHGIHYHHCFSSKIVDVQVTDSQQNGIHIEDRSHNIQVYFSVIRNNKGYGLYEDGTQAQLTINGGNYQENDKGDIFIKKGNGCHISGVYFENANSSVGYQLYINGTASPVAHTVHVSGCYFNGAGVVGGIYVDDSINVVIETVHLESCSPYGIYIDTGAKWTVLINYYQSSSAVRDEGDGTIHISGYYVQLARISHPNTASWNASQAGRIWFCTTHNAVEYWDGSAVQTP